MSKQSQSFISAVIPFVGDTAHVLSFVRDLSEILSKSYEDYEIIIIGYSSKLLNESNLTRLLSEIPFIRILYLKSESSIEVMYSIAIENSIGDIIVSLHPQLDSASELLDAIKAFYKSDGILIGTTNLKKSLTYKILSYLFKSISNRITYLQLPNDATHLKVISREVVNTVFSNQVNPDYFYFYLLNSGYKESIYHYKLAATSMPPERKILDGIKKAFRIVVHKSTSPLRYINGLGLLGSFLALLTSLYSILVNLIKNEIVPGWTTLMFFISFQFSILFLILFFFGAYLARLVEQNTQTWDTVIAFEKNSSVMGLVNTWNISTDENGSALT